MPITGVMVDFCRVATAATAPTEIMPLLANAVVAHAGGDAAAVFRIGEADRLQIVAARGLPPAMTGWSIEAETIGPELGERLLAACDGGFVEAQQFPLVSGGDLFGVLVMLLRERRELTGEQRALAEALADLAAVAVGRAEAHTELQRSYAELRSSREALARTERLRVLGQMAAGISHDVKNLLNPLALQLEVLRRRFERGNREGVLETLGVMRDSIGAGVDVVERLRDFSRQAPEAEVEAEAIDLAPLVTSAIELSRARVAQQPGITLVTDLAPTTAVRVRGSELTTAVVNLIVNATEALGDRGTIRVATGSDADGAWIEVADDGPGMPPDIERRVFEPFFTTKAQGTGLGLAMVYAFVQRKGGRVTVDTAPGRGTRFRLWFPRR